MRTLDVIVAILLVIGGLNWGLVGAFDFNLVEFLFGQLPVIARIIYIVVGLSALYQALFWKAIKTRWK
ncbi:MAG: DUF378 domain-containing protein [Parachlamydiaceae bacterium]